MDVPGDQYADGEYDDFYESEPQIEASKWAEANAAQVCVCARCWGRRG